MIACKGVLHSEMFPLVHIDKANPMEFFQIWLNFTKRSKFAYSHFKMLWKENIPVLKEVDNNGHTTAVNVIAGDFEVCVSILTNARFMGASNHVLILTIKLDAHATWTFPETEADVNRMLYFYRGGAMKIAAIDVSVNHPMQLTSEMDVTLQASSEDC